MRFIRNKRIHTRLNSTATHWNAVLPFRKIFAVWGRGIRHGCSLLSQCSLLFLCFSGLAFATDKIDFDIPRLPAHEALTQFATQANTTLLFPYELAAVETANALTGEFTVELGIVKLLEGTGLYPVTTSNGQLSVRPINLVPTKYATVNPGSGELLEADSQVIRKSTYSEEIQETYIEKIAIVGTRNVPRNAVESTVPLDVISAADMRRQGNTDMLAMLSKMIPSFNVSDQPINDASTLVRPANLRGMASDHTLVLINGKRRHRSAVITFLGGGLSDGAQGPDIAAIPVSGLQQVGVLKDGASAQYGSDAIAGVINFTLKDDNEGGSIETRHAQYYEGDGEAIQVIANTGFGLADDGFVNLSGEFVQREPTSRSVQREDARLLNQAGLGITDPAQVWGTPETHYDVKFALNAGIDVADSQRLYGFTNLARRKIEGGFFFRNPQTRQGVNATPIFDTNSAQVTEDLLFGMPLAYQWLVMDLTPNDGQVCPSVTYSADSFLHLQPEYQDVLNDPNCFAFNEIFPGGFTPKFGGVVEDAFSVVGVKGSFGDGWQYDASVSLGYSSVNYFLSNSVNPSLGPLTPTSFSPGGARQLEKTFNFDVRNSFQLGALEEVNFAGGFEWRRENYQQIQGDNASWQVGPFAIDTVSGQPTGLSVGSNGFPGYRPESAGDWGRGNYAFWVDLETWVTDDLLLSSSLRYENYTDFGRTLDGKFSFLAQLNAALALRGSANTGFKAPTVGQSNVINVTTAFFNNRLQDQATLPPTNPISQQLGATALQPEESVNISVGLVGQLVKDLYVTLDYFRIDLEDRISTTSAIPLTSEDLRMLAQEGIADADRFASVKYFTNDFDTRTEGIDWVLNYVTEFAGVQTQIALNYNWTKTQVERVTLYTRPDATGQLVTESNLTPQRIRMIEENLPAHRGSLTISQAWENVNTLMRLNYFGSYYEDHLDASSGFDIEAGAEVTLDLEFGYQFSEAWQLVVGANNLFDNRPDDNPFSGRAGAIYPTTSPMGINGGLWYGRLLYQF